MNKKQEETHLKFAVLATDVVIFTVRDGKVLMRVSNVDRPPFFNNVPGFPGGLIQPDETADQAVGRIIKEKALISPKHTHIEQFYTFSGVDRDPRGRVVSVGYIALVAWEKLSPEEQSDSNEVWWSEKKSLKNLAYDHSLVMTKAITYLHAKLKSTTLVSKLLPDHFTLTMMENMFESVLGETIDKRNFRKKIAKINVLTELKEKTQGMKHRPAQLYKMKSDKTQEIGLL